MKLKGVGRQPNTDLVGTENFTIGRSKTNNLQIKHKSISRKHIKIARNKSRWEITNLSARKNITVNNQMLVQGKKIKLKNGDLLEITKKIRWIVQDHDEEEEENKKLRNTVEKSKEHIDTMVNKLHEIQNENKELEKELSEKEEKILVLEQKIQDTKKEEEIHKRRANQAMDQALELSDRDETLCRKIEHLKEVLDKKKMKLKELSRTKEKEIYTRLAKETFFQCSICIETLLQPMITNCGHTFCNQCLARWTLESQTCPECRRELIHATRIYMIEEIIQKIIENSNPEKIEERRAQANVEHPVNDQEEPPSTEEIEERRAQVNEGHPVNDQVEPPSIEIIHLDTDEPISSTEDEDEENDPTWILETDSE